MTILQKKILAAQTTDAALAGKGTFSAVVAGLRGLHNDLADICQQLANDEFDPAICDVNVVTTEESFECLPKGGLFYGLKSIENGICMMVGVDAALAAKVTSRALHAESDVTAYYQPSRLDLVLCRSIGNCIIESLRPLFGETLPDMIEGFGLPAMNYNKSSARAMGSLVCVTLALDVETKVTAKDTPRKKGKAKTKGAEPLSITTYEVRLLMPEKSLDALAVNAPTSEQAEDHPVIDVTDPWYGHMRKNVNDAHVNMRVIVETFKMTVADCTRLVIGQTIALPGVSLNSLAIEVDIEHDDAINPMSVDNLPAATDVKRVEIARAKLGIYKSRRAVRLNEDIDPVFFQDIDVVA